jgi:hypothetical protein
MQLKNHPEQLTQLAHRVRKFAQPESAGILAEEIQKLIHV